MKKYQEKLMLFWLIFKIPCKSLSNKILIQSLSNCYVAFSHGCRLLEYLWPSTVQLLLLVLPGPNLSFLKKVNILFKRFCYFFHLVCLWFLVTLENFTHMEMSPLPVKSFSFWPMLGSLALRVPHLLRYMLISNFKDPV